MLLLKRSAPEGVKLMELLTSLFCMCTVTLVAQMVFTCFISYVVFVNPIMITPGLVMYALVLLLAGWMGFFFGKLQQVFNDRKKKKKNTKSAHLRRWSVLRCCILEQHNNIISTGDGLDPGAFT